MADLQPGSLPTTFTAGADTDYLPVSRGVQTGRMLRSEMLLDVPRLLSAVTEVGATWTLTKAAHSNRPVLSGNAAGQAVTFNTASMTTDDGGRVYNTNGAAITFSGATISHAPHLTASSTLTGIRSWVDWRFDGTGITFDARSVDASGGGAANVETFPDMTTVAAAGAANAEETIKTWAIPARATGDRVNIKALFNVQSTTGTVLAKVYIGSVAADTDVYRISAADSMESINIDFDIFCKTVSSQRSKARLSDGKEAVFGPIVSSTANWATSQNIIITIQRVNAARTVTYEAGEATVFKAP